MSVRNVLLLLTAVLVAAGAVYFAQSWLDSERAALEALRVIDKDEEPEVNFILVAKTNLPRGRFVKEEDLRWQAWPNETLDKAYVVQGQGGTPKSFAGAVVRYPIVQGEPVTSARLVRPGERGFLAAALRPGKRAITIPVSVTTGVAGFVLPGDHVDMLLTHRLGRGAYATETLMPDLRVIAIDQRINQKEGAAKVSKTITFEVDPKQVEMVTVARRLGSLSLSLRSLAEEDPAMAKATQSAAKAEEPDAAATTNSSDLEQERADVRAPEDRPIITASLQSSGAGDETGPVSGSHKNGTTEVAASSATERDFEGDPIKAFEEPPEGNPLSPDINRQLDGRGYTYGQEISLLLQERAKRKKVIIIRGGRRQSIAAKPSPSDDDEDGDETEKSEDEASEAEDGEDDVVEAVSEGE